MGRHSSRGPIEKRRPVPKVDLSDMQWGKAVALLCGEMLAEAGAEHIADNETQRWNKRILAFIHRKGTATVRDIQMDIKGRLKSWEIRDQLENLQAAGLIEAIWGERRGKSVVTAYKYTGENVYAAR